MNPIEEFLSEGQKVAAPQWLNDTAAKLPGQLASGAAAAGAGALVAGAGVGMGMLYQAIMKGHNFKKMLQFNEDLAAQHQENPKYVNAAFSTLHRMNSSFASDPMVAGAYVRSAIENPGGVFGQAGLAAGYAPRPGAVQEGMIGGLRMGIDPSATSAHQVGNERMKAIFRTVGERSEVPSGKEKPATRPEDNETVVQRIRKETGR